MSRMFYECSLLSSLPDILRWNTNNTDMSHIFDGYSPLSSLPKIFKYAFKERVKSKLFINNISSGSYKVKFALYEYSAKRIVTLQDYIKTETSY